MTELPTLRLSLAEAAERHYGTRRGRIGRRRLVAAFAMPAVIAALGAGIALSIEPDREVVATPPGGEPGDARRHPPPQPPLPVVQDAAARFSGAVRDGERVASDSTAARVLRHAAASQGQDPATLVLRQLTLPEVTVTLGVGDRVTCLRDQTPSGAGGIGCGSTASAVDPDRPIVSWSVARNGGRDGVRITGAMVDGVSDVAVHLPDGTRVPVAFQANLFSVTVEGEPTKLTYRTPDGAPRAMANPLDVVPDERARGRPRDADLSAVHP